MKKSKIRWVEPGSIIDPPRLRLKTPDPITIHDLTADQRENQIIIGKPDSAYQWHWKPGCPR